jgi:hypothetical protein
MSILYEALLRAEQKGSKSGEATDVVIPGQGENSPARLATPAVPLQDLMAQLAISLRLKLQAWPFGSNRSQGAT